MKNILVATLFMLASVAWAAAQQPGSVQNPSGGQATSPSSQAPGGQSQPSTDSGDPNASRSGQASNAPVTEGCLGGSDPHYTITDNAGTTYKLNIPPNADTSKLAAHVGESVQVLGDVKGNSSINVQSIGRGAGKCPTSGTGGAQSPPRQ